MVQAMRNYLLAGAAVIILGIAGTYAVMGQGMMGGGMMGDHGMMGHQGMMGMRQHQTQQPNATDKKIFQADCSACHTLGAGEGNGLGPNLHGLYGRKAGSMAGFPYSQALTDSGIVWNDATLDKFLADPAARVPGTRMAFAGVKDANQRHKLIAYLKEATK